MGLRKLARKLKGGPGSGHHGHGGRKGKRGGSAPGKGGGSAYEIVPGGEFTGGGSSSDYARANVDFSNSTKTQTAAILGGMLSNGFQQFSVTGKPQSRVEVVAQGKFKRTYDELESMGWENRSTDSDLRHGTRRFQIGPRGNKVLLTQENNPSSGIINIQVK